MKFLAVVGAFITFIIATGIARDYSDAERSPGAAQGPARGADAVLKELIESELVQLGSGLIDQVRARLPKSADEVKSVSEDTRKALLVELGKKGFHAWERASELVVASSVPQASRLRYVEFAPWIGQFKINYFMAVDGLSLPLVWLTALLGVLCLVYSWTIDQGTKAYYALFLILETGLIGVFCALDFFLFYVFWEIVLLPMWFLIGIWGGPNRIYAAIKFFIYTLVGSVIMLLAMLVFYFKTEPHTFNIITLMGLTPLTYSLQLQTMLFLALFIGFAIKVPVFPFHTWLPDAHVEAPTAISVVLAGVLLKMGGYGFFRFSYPLLPQAATQRGMIWFIAILALINIVYGAFCAMAQKDFKKLVAYSSVSHMGYVLLGLASLSYMGIDGAVLQMFTHGISSAMLFFIVGVIYDRAHHRDLDRFGGIGLQMPWYTGIATVGFFTSLGLPGLCGFISEVLVFLGSWDTSMSLITTPAGDKGLGARWIVYVSLLGVVLAAVYILWTIQRVYLGNVKDEHYKHFPDLSFREVVALVPLAFLCVVIGLLPNPTILNHIDPSLRELTDMVRKAAGL
ncbi:MAG: NADH-quinone oxidoreductase subunit M [Planctomycetes bacterium]|nr:NADH-quinone oxidoreductase subunit M [Planctomycetota bacterium]